MATIKEEGPCREMLAQKRKYFSSVIRKWARGLSRGVVGRERKKAAGVFGGERVCPQMYFKLLESRHWFHHILVRGFGFICLHRLQREGNSLSFLRSVSSFKLDCQWLSWVYLGTPVPTQGRPMCPKSWSEQTHSQGRS